jgi:LPS O-antigen subunit length determinant protein (WzzB/FepE family)
MKKANPAAAATTTPGTSAVPTPVTPEKEDPTMLLPRVEVNQTRITELAIALHEKDVEIAREKKNIKPTGLDESLNDKEVAHKLAVFGGSSSEDRSRLAEERVMLLESERDLIEQIFNARTEEERAVLQKQADDLKTMRRQLERTPKDTRGE